MKKILLMLSIVLGLTACSTTSNTNYYGREETYTVSQPVEVIYRNTTYRTVYEPKTYKEVTLERRPYNSNNCIKRKINHCK